MADTSYTVNDPSTVKLWSKYLESEVLKNTWIMKFTGTSADSLIMVKTETQKSAGDRITFALRMQMTGDGVAGDNTLEGNEEALTTYTDNLFIDQLRHAHRSGGRMSQQRVTWDMRQEAREALADWWEDRLDFWGLNQLAGNVAQSNTKYTGMQATIAPSANNQKWVNSNEASDQSISTTSTFTLSMIDKAVEAARTLTPAIRPLRIGGKPMYAVFMHDYQVTDMRTNTSTGQWLDIQKSAMQGGEIDDNPIFNGSLGVYNGTIIHQDSRIPLGVNSSTSAAVASTRRAIFCGAQAAVMGYGMDNGPNRFVWSEETFDYGNKLGVSVGMIGGLKKTVYNSADYGVIVLSTYAAAH